MWNAVIMELQPERGGAGETREARCSAEYCKVQIQNSVHHICQYFTVQL